MIEASGTAILLGDWYKKRSLQGKMLAVSGVLGTGPTAPFGWATKSSAKG